MTWFGVALRLVALAFAWTWLAANGLIIVVVLLALAGFVDEIWPRAGATTDTRPTKG